MSDPATLAFYQANATRYSEHFSRAPSRHLDGFLDRLKRGARVLELGCGGGQDSARMAARGFAIDPTDATPAMVAAARAAFDVPARRMRFDELASVAAYDAVWAHACLIHVARANFAGVLAAIHRALRPGGWHFANFKLGDGEGRDPLGRLTNFPDEIWLEDAYRTAGFAVVETDRYRGEGADGVVRDWYALTVRRDETAAAQPQKEKGFARRSQRKQRSQRVSGCAAPFALSASSAPLREIKLPPAEPQGSGVELDLDRALVRQKAFSYTLLDMRSRAHATPAPPPCSLASARPPASQFFVPWTV